MLTETLIDIAGKRLRIVSHSKFLEAGILVTSKVKVEDVGQTK
jgi:hypothetical protein